MIGPLPERAVVHLDAGYSYQPCREMLVERELLAEIATRGKPTPVQAGAGG